MSQEFSFPHPIVSLTSFLDGHSSFQSSTSQGSIEDLQFQIAHLNEQLSLSDQDVMGLQGVMAELQADLQVQRELAQSLAHEVRETLLNSCCIF